MVVKYPYKITLVENNCFLIPGYSRRLPLPKSSKEKTRGWYDVSSTLSSNQTFLSQALHLVGRVNELYPREESSQLPAANFGGRLL